MPSAIAAVPDGMANGVLAGVNPVQGLYASLVGRVAGGLTASTKMMVITTTSAAALAAGSAIEAIPDAQRSDALVWLTLIAGASMLVGGMVGLSRYVRFVSQSVMLGFLTGLSANILFGQLPALTGSPSQGSFALTKALNVRHPSDPDAPAFGCRWPRRSPAARCSVQDARGVGRVAGRASGSDRRRDPCRCAGGGEGLRPRGDPARTADPSAASSSLR